MFSFEMTRDENFWLSMHGSHLKKRQDQAIFHTHLEIF